MAYQINHNVPTSTGSGTTIVTNPVNASHFASDADNPNKAGEVFFTNYQSPFSLPEKISLKRSRTNDIYAGLKGKSRIARIEQLPSTAGIKLLIHNSQTWTIEDTDDPTAPKYKVPVVCNITVQIPEHELVSVNDVMFLLKETLGIAYADGNDHWLSFLNGGLTL